MPDGTAHTITVSNTLDALGLGLVVYRLEDPDAEDSFTFFEVNDHASILTGLPMHEFIGHRLTEMVPSVAAAGLLPVYVRVARTGVAETIDAVRLSSQPMAGQIFRLTVISPGENLVSVIFDNITERRRIEQALRDSHDELEWRVRARTAELREVNDALHALIDASPFAIVSLDRDGRVRSWNRAAEQIFGWSAVEAVGNIHPIVPADEVSHFQERLARIAEGDRRWQGAERLRLRKDGSCVHVRISHAILTAASGEEIGLIALIEDLSNEHAGRELAARAERQMALLRTLTDAVHRAADIEDLLAALARHLAPVQIAGGVLSLKLPGHEREERFAWAIDADTVEELELDARTGEARVRFSPEAAERFVSWHVVPVESRQGIWGCALFVSEVEGLFDEELQRVLRVVGGELGVSVENVVLYRNMEDAIARAHELSQRIAAIRESERRHIGRELHDQLGQSLTALKLFLETGSRSDSPAAKQLRSAARLVSEIIAEVRNVSLALRGPMLDYGLFAALRALFERCRVETSVLVDCACSGNDADLSQPLAVTAYRIVQEALTNVARHAGIGAAKVAVRITPSELMLRVDDDGYGFDAEATLVRPTGGLSGIIDRVELAGGRVRIDSHPGAGTHIEVQIPRESEVAS